MFGKKEKIAGTPTHHNISSFLTKLRTFTWKIQFHGAHPLIS